MLGDILSAGPNDEFRVKSDGTMVVTGQNATAGVLSLAHQSWTGAQAHATSTTGVHAAVTDTGSDQTVTTAITNPPTVRNITATSGGTAANITAVQVIITGTDYNDAVITETLPVFTATSATTVVGSKAFKTVTSILVPANGSGVTTAIGYGSKLGLGNKLSLNTVLKTYLNSVLEGTAPTVAVDAANICNNTISLNSSLNGTAVDTFYIVA